MSYVIKLGGSLLDCPDLPRRFHEWLARQPASHGSLVVCGGGELVEEIRRLHQRFSLAESTSHELCCGLLDITGQLLAEVLRLRPMTWEASQDSLHHLTEPGVLLPRDFLLRTEPECPGVKLSASWDVTSDSIAARIADVLRADELVLLKSASAPTMTRDEAAQRGFVDRFFPRAASPLKRVRCVNLRDDLFPETELL